MCGIVWNSVEWCGNEWKRVLKLFMPIGREGRETHFGHANFGPIF